MTMKAIWKKPVIRTELQVINVPKGAEPLCVQMQGDSPHIWFKCDPTQPGDVMAIRMVGTGHPFNDEGLKYIGTVQDRMGLVWHYFLVP